MTKFRSLLAGASVLVVATSFVGAELAYSQMGTGSDAIGGGGAAIGGGAASTSDVVARGRRQVAAASSVPVGPGLPRMPLTTPQVMPYLSTTGDASQVGEAGSSLDAGFEGQAFGTATEQWPYSVARVAVTGTPGTSVTPAQVPVTSKPYRQTGKLWMRFGSSWFVCTASLIKKGVLVTAAHCVHNFGEGASGFADEVRWHPANLNSSANGGPYGFYNALDWYIPAVYHNGTDTCQNGAIGIVCNNDLAIVILQGKNGVLPGVTLGGWYGYGWNGFSYTTSPAFGNHLISDISQLGYPVALDNGYQMQRNNSFGKYITTSATNTSQQLRNTQLGSALTGGSSGGPWLVNFGTKPTVTGNASLGQQSAANTVVGVTSWGYTDPAINVQGASWFGQNNEFPNANYGGYGAGNIGRMVEIACTAYPGRCAN